MSRVNYYQSAFNLQKEKLNILAEMLEISKSGCCCADLYTIIDDFTIRASVGANKTASLYAPQTHILNEFVMLHFNSEGLDLDFMHF